MSSFTVKHSRYEYVTCINYAELFETDKNRFKKFEQILDDFLKEEVKYEDLNDKDKILNKY